MNRKLLVFGLALTLLVAGCGGGESTDEPIKIGVIADLTGAFTTYGTSLSRSTQLAAKEINAAGGIDGRQIEVVVEDIQTDVTATVDKGRKLVDSDKVDLVIGPIGSDANDAAYKTVVQDGGKLLFYTETYEGGKCDPLYFSFGAVPAQQIRPMIPLLQDQYGPNVMLFGADYVWPRRSFEIAKPIIEENGGNVVSELYLPLVADDFSELVQEVRESSLTTSLPCILPFGDLPSKRLMTPVCSTRSGSGPLSSATRILRASQTLRKATTQRSPSSPLPTVPELPAFWTRSQPNTVQARSHQAVKGSVRTTPSYMYKAAVEKAGSTDPTAVAEALVGLSFDGPTGTVTMTSDHHLAQTIYLVQAVNGEYRLVDSFANRDPEESCNL